jgi:uncharacterized SAM-binding protein YcdF (DUF218 family)
MKERQSALAASLLRLIVLTPLALRDVYRPIGDGDPEPARAIMVLGARAGPNGPSPALRARAQRAAELYAEGWAPEIVCTGRPEELAAMRSLLLSADAVAADIVELAAGSTRHSMIAIASYLGREPTVLVVSSPYHLQRSLEEARRHGLRAVGCASRLGDPPSGAIAWLRHRVRLDRNRLREIVAIWVYRISPGRTSWRD